MHVLIRKWGVARWLTATKPLKQLHLNWKTEFDDSGGLEWPPHRPRRRRYRVLLKSLISVAFLAPLRSTTPICRVVESAQQLFLLALFRWRHLATGRLKLRPFIRLPWKLLCEELGVRRYNFWHIPCTRAFFAESGGEGPAFGCGAS